VAVDTDVAAAIIARSPGVGVTHGHLTNKPVLVVAYKRIPSMLVDDNHEYRAGRCRCLPNMAFMASPWGPDLASWRLKAEVRAARKPLGSSTLSSGWLGPLLPIDGSREVDLDWIHVGCSCWFCCWSVSPCASEQNPSRGLMNFEAVPGEICQGRKTFRVQHVKTKEM
jgi:hypothetical protein